MNSRSICHFRNSTAFYATVEMYLAIPVFSGYVKEVWLSILSL